MKTAPAVSGCELCSPADVVLENVRPDILDGASSIVKQSIGLVSLVVNDYDEGIAFYVGVLGFALVEDTPVHEQHKRWVVVSPPGATETRLLLAKAANPMQTSRVGNQTGGRVFLFLYTDDFARDYRAFQERGVVFVRDPKQEPYGTVAVFRDPWGNLWDLLQPDAAYVPGAV